MLIGTHSVEMGEDGSYSIIWLPIDGSGTYKTALDYSKKQPGDVSLSSGIPGIVLAFNKITTNGSNQVMDFLVRSILVNSRNCVSISRRKEEQ